MRTFGQHLMAWRRLRKMTQQELSLKARIPQPNLSALESDRLDPQLSTLRRLAHALEISFAELLDEGPPLPVLGRHEIDGLLRDATRSSSQVNQNASPWADALRVVLHDRRAAKHGRNSGRTSPSGSQRI